MSQELTSPAFYREPREEEIACFEVSSSFKQRLLAAKEFVTVFFWGIVLASAVFVVCRGVWFANHPQFHSEQRSTLGKDILSIFANLVDFDWNKHVDDRIQRNENLFEQNCPFPVDEVPEILLDSPEVQLPATPAS